MPPKEVKEKKVRRVGKRNKDGAKDAVAELSESAQKINLDNNRSSTGVLTSEKNSRDIKVRSLRLLIPLGNRLFLTLG